VSPRSAVGILVIAFFVFNIVMYNKAQKEFPRAKPKKIGAKKARKLKAKGAGGISQGPSID